MTTPLADSLVIYVVYWDAKDFPGMWVVRRQAAGAGGIWKDPHLWAEGFSLQEVRKRIPDGLYRQSRQDGDDPAIFEVWF